MRRQLSWIVAVGVAHRPRGCRIGSRLSRIFAHPDCRVAPAQKLFAGRLWWLWWVGLPYCRTP